jgi:hypothetical protein
MQSEQPYLFHIMVVRFKISDIKYKIKGSYLEIFQYCGIIICSKMWGIRQDTTGRILVADLQLVSV